MPYLNDELRQKIADTLGLTSLSIKYQDVNSEVIYPIYYWIIYLESGGHTYAPRQWILGFVRTENWSRGMIAPVNRYEIPLQTRSINLTGWRDVVTEEIGNLNLLTNIDNSIILGGGEEACEIEFQTMHTKGNLEFRNLLLLNQNIRDFWNTLLNVIDQFNKASAKKS